MQNSFTTHIGKRFGISGGGRAQQQPNLFLDSSIRT
jgi:hypothetical protein